MSRMLSNVCSPLRASWCDIETLGTSVAPRPGSGVPRFGPKVPRTGWGRQRPARASLAGRCTAGVRGSGGGGLVLSRDVAGAVRVDLDARAHRRGDGDLLDVAALGAGRLQTEHL